MHHVVEDLTCELLHGEWAEVVSYSSQGAWRCGKPGCAAQVRHDRAAMASRTRMAIKPFSALAAACGQGQTATPRNRAA
jgi:hypothetical protein